MTAIRSAAEERLFARALAGVEQQLGGKFPSRRDGSPAVVGRRESSGQPPLVAFHRGEMAAIGTRDEWLSDVRSIADRLHPDLLFSVVGMFELSRITLPDGFAAWGPVPCYLADEEVWRPEETHGAIRLDPAQLDAVDWDVFWHCDQSPGSVYFGIYEQDHLVALASAAGRGLGVTEIGMDVHPSAKGRGLGSAVVSAAGNWVLDQGDLISATAALWNVPSGRTLRRLGLHYIYSTIIARPGPFFVPPQPLGVAAPGQPIFNYYPRWAMNDAIRERESAP